ncbi:hypothetical protein ACOCJ5_10310 [Knoellia sp. CPCC 206450]|uniref:hypothetical protein n=1 Tax=Knoellia tibetensis TaxID=3404798 RepID=UPI003B42BBCD
MDSWATPEKAKRFWPDAENLDPEHLDELLETATEACAAYAPSLPDGTPRPRRHELAVIFHARDLHTAAERKGDSDLVGVADYAIRARPLADAVRQLLRPRHAVPRFGAPT